MSILDALSLLQPSSANAGTDAAPQPPQAPIDDLALRGEIARRMREAFERGVNGGDQPGWQTNVAQNAPSPAPQAQAPKPLPQAPIKPASDSTSSFTGPAVPPGVSVTDGRIAPPQAPAPQPQPQPQSQPQAAPQYNQPTQKPTIPPELSELSPYETFSALFGGMGGRGLAQAQRDRAVQTQTYTALVKNGMSPDLATAATINAGNPAVAGLIAQTLSPKTQVINNQLVRLSDGHVIADFSDNKPTLVEVGTDPITQKPIKMWQPNSKSTQLLNIDGTPYNPAANGGVGAFGGAISAAARAGVTGDAMLKIIADQYGPTIATRVNALVNGDEVPERGDKESMALEPLVYAVKPDWNKTQVQQAAAFRKSFTDPNHTNQKQILALNNALNHSADYMDKFLGKIPDYNNALGNYAQTGFGFNPLNNKDYEGANELASFLGPEMVKVASGAEGGTEERKAAAARFDPSKGRAKVEANLSAAGGVLEDKLRAFVDQWHSINGDRPIPPEILTPRAQEIVARLKTLRGEPAAWIPPTANTAAPAAPAANPFVVPQSQSQPQTPPPPQIGGGVNMSQLGALPDNAIIKDASGNRFRVMGGKPVPIQ